MNSLFNYELDERNIRLALKDSDMPFSESAWEDFDANYNVASSKPALDLHLPKFDLNINRSFVVPLFFIIALGGMSALLFSFVDFKSNKPAQAEKTLEPDPSNYKKEVVTTAPVKEDKKEVEVKVEKKNTTSEITVNNVQTAPQVVASPNSNALTQVNSQPSQEVKQLHTQQNQVGVTQEIAKTNSTPVLEQQQASARSVAAPSTEPQQFSAKPRKKRKRISGEQIETIKAPSLVGQETTSEEEPELRLK